MTRARETTPATIHAAILGASGYGAGELLRLLAQHPDVRVVSVTSTSQVGEPLERVHPHLRGFYELRVSERPDLHALLSADHAVVFSGLPHGASAAALHHLLQSADPRLKLIDLSGDLRLQDERLHEEHYPETPLFAELRHSFVYGLPELYRTRIQGARWIANPGCLASTAILAAAPLAADGYRGVLAIDAKTGSSGAGRSLKETTHHPTRHADFRAYRPLAHQHEPEILQALGDPAGERLALSFVAQSMDVTRGIFATVHAMLPQPLDVAALHRRYRDFYRDAPFVRVVEGSPTLQDVVGSNFCDVAVAARGRQVLVMAALDNLVKGMAGTAIQNMNLMCGLEERTGLWTPSLRPL
jgi:N-acetyl-gamma-glutamyl-phosphate/LysW-gamma-L-alpha-aminoadipyl-6-phosphate reductase